MPEYAFQPLFPPMPDSTEYEAIGKEHVSTGAFEGREIVKIAPEGLTALAERAFTDIAFLLRASHLAQLAAILKDPESSANDRTVALELIKNAVISADRVLPMCQDTGTAVIMGKKGQQVWTGGNDEDALARGVFNAYTKNYFRYSQNAPLGMYDEKNTGSNLPAQVDIAAEEGAAYMFLCIAKGGGSSNKTYLFQETKAVLNADSLPKFLIGKIRGIGTAACPPYHLGIVVGGTSPELVLKTVKLASARYLDEMPTKPGPAGYAYRDVELENLLLEASRKLGLGAGFGGKYFCLDARVIRLPRHGASCPIGLGVSCNADRNIKSKITRDGMFIERLESDPAKYLPVPGGEGGEAVAIDLNRPMSEIRATLSKYPVATRLSLSGPIIVARDIAHARLKEKVDKGEDLPDYFKNHIIYYAGPAKTPPGYPSGSMGPTTAGRMDNYVPIFQKMGGSLVMLAKGNRSKVVTESCKTYGGFYLGSIGGPAAKLAKDNITSQEVVAYPELGMEAIYKITVKDFPAFILVDDKGNDFYAPLMG
jgi:fumarate hydratase class I